MSVHQHTNVCDCSRATGHSALCLLQCSGSSRSDLVAGEISDNSAYPYSLCSLSLETVMSRLYDASTAAVCWSKLHIAAIALCDQGGIVCRCCERDRQRHQCILAVCAHCHSRQPQAGCVARVRLQYTGASCTLAAGVLCGPVSFVSSA